MHVIDSCLVAYKGYFQHTVDYIIAYYNAANYIQIYLDICI